MNVTKVSLHKTADIITEGKSRGSIYTARNITDVIETLSASALPAFLSVTWQVVENAPVSVEKQNATMLRRAKKIATGLGREVEAYDRVNGITYGCVLV